MSRFDRAISLLTEHHGSTRSAGILRCLWGLILWARWANELLPFKRHELDHYVLGLLFFASTFGMVIGFFSRLSCFVAGLVTLTMVFYYGYIVGFESWSHHHTTFLAVVTFVLAFTPSGQSFSLDRVLAIRKAEKQGLSWPTEFGNVWALRLIGLQLSAIYFWGAIDKCRLAYLGGDRIEQPFMYLYFGSDYPGDWFHFFAIGLAVSTVTLEYFLAFGLWVRRVMFPLMILGVLFHIGIYYLLPVTVFSVASVAAYLAYMPPDEVHRFIDRMFGIRSVEE